MPVKATYPRIPSIDHIKDQDVRDPMKAMVEGIQILQGQRGTILQRAIIVNDLVRLGLIQVRSQGSRYEDIFNPLEPPPPPLTNSIGLAGTTAAAGSLELVRIDHTDSPYSLTGFNVILLGDTDGGAITINLAVGVDGTRNTIKNAGESGNNITLVPNGAETVEDDSVTSGESYQLVYETTEGWLII